MAIKLPYYIHNTKHGGGSKLGSADVRDHFGLGMFVPPAHVGEVVSEVDVWPQLKTLLEAKSSCANQIGLSSALQ